MATRGERSFILGCLMTLIPHILLTVPKYLYLMPLAPVLIASASRFKFPLLALALLSPVNYWVDFIKNLVSDVKQGDIRVLDGRDRGRGMRRNFKKIESLIADCRGVMALEHTFLGAFSNLSQGKIYDVWEIPPYGRLHASKYNGLRPDRIDCLLISKTLQTDKGIGTNFGIRYQNYVQPYMQELLLMGASSIELPSYGKAIILGACRREVK